MRSIVRSALFGSCVFLLPTLSYATIIAGSQLSTNGDATVSAAFITFACDIAGDSSCAAGTGDFLTSSLPLSTSGSFAQYRNTDGRIGDLNNVAQPLNDQGFDAGTGPFTKWITFTLNNNINIELDFIPLGTDEHSTTCTGATSQFACTPTNPALVTADDPGGVSAFNLTYDGTNTVAAFHVVGIVHDTTDGSSAPIVGVFSAQFANQNIAQVLSQLGTGITSTYSTNFALTVVPEPMTFSLLGLGLLGMGLIGRKRFAKK